MAAANQEATEGLPDGYGHSLLLTDLYQLNMMQAYLEAGMTEPAVFEFFVRRLPERRGFLLAAGLEQVVAFLEQAHFSEAELRWLADSGRFGKGLIRFLETLRFEGDLHALPEGTVCFPDEPILRVTASLPVAQLFETRIINLLHFQTLIASKAARMVLAAPGKQLVDFGLRRAHGAEAGLLAARASHLAGFAGSATTAAERCFGVPAFGTMAHSFIQAHKNERQAFESFARARPEAVVLLLDTYDTLSAARKVAELAPRLAAEGITVRGVRLDSGDLLAEAKAVRAILDRAGLPEIRIFASGGIDEDALLRLAGPDSPIEGFGIGTSLTTSQDAPALDCAYKIQDYAGRPTRKLSTGKATWPGRKQVWRRYDAEGAMAGDSVTLADETAEGEPLVQPVMADGQRVADLPNLAAARRHAADQLARLPAHLKALAHEPAYPVVISSGLRRLASQCDEAIKRA